MERLPYFEGWTASTFLDARGVDATSSVVQMEEFLFQEAECSNNLSRGHNPKFRESSESIQKKVSTNRIFRKQTD